jgi:excisionase family DNA binding protein
MEKKYITAQELAKYLNYRVGTIYNKISKGELPFQIKRIGKKLLFDLNEVHKFLE